MKRLVSLFLIIQLVIGMYGCSSVVTANQDAVFGRNADRNENYSWLQIGLFVTWRFALMPVLICPGDVLCGSPDVMMRIVCPSSYIKNNPPELSFVIDGKTYAVDALGPIPSHLQIDPGLYEGRIGGPFVTYATNVDVELLELICNANEVSVILDGESHDMPSNQYGDVRKLLRAYPGYEKYRPGGGRRD